MVLNILRSKKVAKKVLLGLLILIVPAFVLWGVGNLGEGPPSVGKISGRTISARDLAESVQGIHAQLVFSYYGDFQALNRILQNRSLINNMAWEPCPNPECDPEGGCCLCDHTGKILTYVLDKMQVKQADASRKG